MKNIFLSFILFQTVLVIAQMPGQRPPTGMMPVFNAKNAAGIIKYEDEKVFKKVKINDNTTKKKVSEALTTYNNVIDEIVFLNTDKFKEIETQVKEKRELAMATRDREAMMAAQQESREKLAPIKKQVNTATANLNANLEKILSEKQYSKWLKYQKNKKSALKPKSSMGGQNPQRGQGRGQGHGGGGGRGGMMGF